MRPFQKFALLRGGGSGGSGGAPVDAYATNENLSEQSTTGTSLDGAALAASLESGVDYLFFWSQDVQTNTTSTAGSDVLVNGSTVFGSDLPVNTPHETSSPIDYFAHGGFFKHTASGSAETWALKANRGVASTLKVRNSRLSYLKMGADDEYAESLTRQTFADPANKSAQTAASLNFTPPSTGDYIVIASFIADMANASNVQVEVELTDGTATTTPRNLRPQETTTRQPVMLILRLAAASGAKTVDLKIRQPGSGSTTIAVSNIRIVAIREDRFANVYATNLAASSSGTETSYTTALSQTFTPQAAPHLMVAGWLWRTTSTSVSIYSQLDDGGVSVNEGISEFGEGSGSGKAAISHRLADYAASSRTQALQRKAETSSATATIWGGLSGNQGPASIVTFDLTGIS